MSGGRGQALRKLHMAEAPPTPVASGKPAVSAVHKIVVFVNDNVLGFDPATDAEGAPLSFVPREPDTLNNMLDLVQSECPRLLRSHSYFIDKASEAYATRFTATDSGLLLASDTVDDRRPERDEARQPLEDLQREPLVVAAREPRELQHEGGDDEPERKLGEDGPLHEPVP